jgi:rSAM/selenodomain-associated transferase 1
LNHPHGSILLFARTPRSGEVKTRLATDLGADLAYRLYCAMLEHSVRTATRAGMARVIVYVYPDVESAFIRYLQARYAFTLCKQQGQDLGERMLAASREQLRETDFVILIGSDCPLIDSSYLQQTAARLGSGSNLIFGPADDGGYVMAAMSRPYSTIFEGINWGSDAVMTQTRQRCREQGLDWAELHTLFDIDRVQDWQRLQREHPHVAEQLLRHADHAGCSLA